MTNLPVPIQPRTKVEELRLICKYIDNCCPLLLSWQKQYLVDILFKHRGEKMYVLYPTRSGRAIFLESVQMMYDLLQKEKKTNDQN
jgi:hypothetical protein